MHPWDRLWRLYAIRCPALLLCFRHSSCFTFGAHHASLSFAAREGAAADRLSHPVPAAVPAVFLRALRQSFQNTRGFVDRAARSERSSAIILSRSIVDKDIVTLTIASFQIDRFNT